MKLARGSKLVIVLGSLALLLYFFMLYFRAFIYPDMFIAPDDPYGPSDIIELLLVCLLMLLTAVSAVVSLIIFFRGAKQAKLLASGLLVLHAVIYASYSFLHSLAANYG